MVSTRLQSFCLYYSYYNTSNQDCVLCWLQKEATPSPKILQCNLKQGIIGIWDVEREKQQKKNRGKGREERGQQSQEHAISHLAAYVNSRCKAKCPELGVFLVGWLFIVFFLMNLDTHHFHHICIYTSMVFLSSHWTWVTEDSSALKER